MGDSDCRTGLCDLTLSRGHLPALLCHPSNHSVWECQSLKISTIHFEVCTSRVPGKVLRWEELELSRPLKQDEMNLPGGSLCCRSALHSTGMVGIELAAVLGDSEASIDDTPWRRQRGFCLEILRRSSSRRGRVRRGLAAAEDVEDGMSARLRLRIGRGSGVSRNWMRRRVRHIWYSARGSKSRGSVCLRGGCWRWR
jgi:hypothetical protein